MIHYPPIFTEVEDVERIGDYDFIKPDFIFLLDKLTLLQSVNWLKPTSTFVTDYWVNARDSRFCDSRICTNIVCQVIFSSCWYKDIKQTHWCLQTKWWPHWIAGRHKTHGAAFWVCLSMVGEQDIDICAGSLLCVVGSSAGRRWGPASLGSLVGQRGRWESMKNSGEIYYLIRNAMIKRSVEVTTWSTETNREIDKTTYNESTRRRTRRCTREKHGAVLL